jgi:predicted RNase H-related nuclease YkuK (DUF458 family)
MISPTYGRVDIHDVVHLISDYVIKNQKESEGFNVIVGTDSQNFKDTKTVLVIAVQNIHRGGFFFYDVKRVNKISDVRKKLTYETQTSLRCMDRLLGEFDKYFDETGFDYTDLNFSIHIDAGISKNGKTSELIPGLVAWVHSCGYPCKVKPDSFVASSIADKISK